MKLLVLGTGTAIPRIERGSSAYLVTARGAKVLVDVGPAVVRRLLEKGHEVDDVDVIVLTHFHVDHTADLSTFFFACNYGRVPRQKPLTVIGGKGLTRFYRGLRAVYPWVVPKSYDLTIQRLVNGSLTVSGLTITTVPVNHNPESIAVRLDGKRSITFSGDTDVSPNLVRLADRTDILVAECAFPERKVKGHLNLAALDRIVQRTRPERVILTHLYPDWDNWPGVLHAPYLIGEDGMEMEV
ncbi:MAG: Ribonuclease Z [Syntrophorhabdus sp. PtaB.Bin047]|jgi:ribonuclease BN (tRNA processing enzyme)|nr:MAG: Ribonuclease Z [Syntrophorhabdus sp. PtaB.Bin047]